jgi:hypothetical protein
LGEGETEERKMRLNVDTAVEVGLGGGVEESVEGFEVEGGREGVGIDFLNRSRNEDVAGGGGGVSSDGRAESGLRCGGVERDWESDDVSPGPKKWSLSMVEVDCFRLLEVTFSKVSILGK